MDDGTVAAMGIISMEIPLMKFVANFCTFEASSLRRAKISVMRRLVSPRVIGKTQMESGRVRSLNQRAPPTDSSSHTEIECVAPRLRLRKARDIHTHIGSCTHTSTLALNGWQLSLMYSSDTIRFRFLLN